MTITKESLQPFDAYNQRALFSIFSRWGLPQTMIDIGSGSGIMTATARRLGVNAIGIDVIAEPPDLKRDLNEPADAGIKADLIVTIETAEHIHNTESFIQTIQNHTKPGTVLVFTAAVPGQQGDGHVNCQTKEFWRERLTAVGYTYDPKNTALIAEWWRYSAGGLSAWLSPNLQIFRNGGLE